MGRFERVMLATGLAVLLSATPAAWAQHIINIGDAEQGAGPDTTQSVPAPSAPPSSAPAPSAPTPSAPAAAEPRPDRSVSPPTPPSSPPVLAQKGPPPGAEENGRYTFHQMGDALIRLDTRSGDLSQCSSGIAGWTCMVIPNERTALDAEIARLRRENGELKKALLSRGLDLPAGVVADASPAMPSGAAPSPAPVPPASIQDPAPQAPKAGQGQVDRAIAVVKHVWRQLVEAMADLQRDVQRKS